MIQPIRILVVGCGNMGISHARAYQKMSEFEIVGFVSQSPEKRPWIKDEFPNVKHFTDFYKALEELKPAAVSINTYPDTHCAFALASMQAGVDVFLEKPIAQTVEQAEKIYEMALKTKRKVMVGYILRYHPSWKKFVSLAKELGKPLVMRMNLNQQSDGPEWIGHKNLLKSLSPIVDCGVHYIDMMCLMTEETPVRVHAIGARLSDEIRADMYNYGQLQIEFKDGSVGWYEAGWGPMMSEDSYFIKDIIGPKGSISMAKKKSEGGSADIDSHTKTDGILFHKSKLDLDGKFAFVDEMMDLSKEPSHQELCDLEQAYFLNVIQNDIDITSQLKASVLSLRVVLAADESIKQKKSIEL